MGPERRKPGHARPHVRTLKFRGIAEVENEKIGMHCEQYIPINCDPNGIRTRATAVRGRRTRPLYDGAALLKGSGLRSPNREFRWGTRTRT